MTTYLTLYLVFGLLFLAGAVMYWVVTTPLKDPSKLYEKT